MSDRISRDERAPASTVNTATDRELGFDRGMGVGYLDVAIDALVHLLQRTAPGRAWVVGDAAIEALLESLTTMREELLRKERIDARTHQATVDALSQPVPWNRRGVRE
jgi:hypothetical protein